MKTPRNAFAIIIFLVGVCLCEAQQAVTNGNLRIVFPTSAWSETEAPAQLRDVYENPASHLKLLFHAVSQPAKLRFFVTSLDYPPNSDRSLVTAGYLDGVRRRVARQAVGAVSESRTSIGDFPVYTFEAKASGELFLELREVIGADRLYSLEIGGPAASHQEAKQCLDGVSLINETEPPHSIVRNVSEVQTKVAMERAYQKGHQIGYALGFIIVVVLVVAFVWFIIRVARRGKGTTGKPQPISSSAGSPPVIPT